MKVIFSLALLALIATEVLCAPAGQNPPPPMPLPQPLMVKRQSYQQQQPYNSNYRGNSPEDWSREDMYKNNMRYNNGGSSNGYNQVNPYGMPQYSQNTGMRNGMGYNSGSNGMMGSQYPYNQNQGYYQG
jgi:hypothetical protein